MWGLGTEASLPGGFLEVLYHQDVMSVPFRTQRLQVTETHSREFRPPAEFIVTLRTECLRETQGTAATSLEGLETGAKALCGNKLVVLTVAREPRGRRGMTGCSVQKTRWARQVAAFQRTELSKPRAYSEGDRVAGNHWRVTQSDSHF